MIDEDFYVVPFTSAGRIGCLTIASTKESALLSQRQLRAKYPSVRIMTREQFLAAQEKEDAERRSYW